MAIIPPGYAELVVPLKHSGLTRAAQVTFGLQLNDSISPTDVDNFQNALFHVDSFKGCMDSNVQIGPSECRVGQDAGEALVVVGTTGFPGTASRSNSISPNCAVLIHKRTARGGRRGRGRCYLPWALDDDGYDEVGAMAPAAVSPLNTRCSEALSKINALAVVDALVLLHSEGISSPGLPNVITSMYVDLIVGTQRRRLGR